jgi:hypothetical protein
MKKGKIIAVAVAALVIAGCAAVVLWPSEDRGWYAWDPTVGEVEYAKISATPRIVETIERMYSIAYGTDVPAPATGARIAFDPIAGITDGITWIKSSGTGPGINESTLYFTEEMTSNMRIISYGLGFTDSYIQMLGENVWDTVVAAGNSTWNAYPSNGMVWNETLAAEMTLSTVNLLSFLESSDADPDYTYCMVVWGYMLNYEAVMKAIEGYDNVHLLCVDYYKATGSLNYLLSVIDALGWLVGKNTDDNATAVNFQERVCAISNVLSSSTKTPTVYMELPAGTSPGANTLTQLCFDLLHLKNINETTGTNLFGDANVITSAPDVIFFDVKDSRPMDQRMRVTT